MSESEPQEEQGLTHGDLLALVEPESPPERQLAVTPDGWEYDVITGEVTRFVGLPERFEVNSEADADFVLEIRSRIEAEIVAVDARLKALAAQLHAIRQQAIRKLSWWEWRFAPSLVVFARSILTGKSRTARFAWGSVSFRSTRGANQILDMDAAVQWMRTFAPEKVKVKETVTVTDVLAVRAALARELGETEEHLPWLKSEAPAENVTISTGIEVEAKGG
jgi:hypothetical protein